MADERIHRIACLCFLLIRLSVYAVPTISRAGDQQTFVNSPTNTIVYTVSDTAFDPSLLSIRISSSNSSVIQQQSSVISGWSDSMRTVVLFPVNNVQGSALINVTVTNPNNETAVDKFKVTVLGPTYGGLEIRANRTQQTSNLTCQMAFSFKKNVTYVKCLNTCQWTWQDPPVSNLNAGNSYPFEVDLPTYFSLCDPYYGGLSVPTDVSVGQPVLNCSYFMDSNTPFCDTKKGNMFLTPQGYYWSSYAGCVHLESDECRIWLSCKLPCCNSSCLSTYCHRDTTCYGHGTCASTGACICDTNWYNQNCSKYCQANFTCSGHGYCNSTDGSCVCQGYWTGSNCGTPPPLIAITGSVYQVGLQSPTPLNSSTFFIQIFSGSFGLFNMSTSTGRFDSSTLSPPQRVIPGWYNVKATQVFGSSLYNPYTDIMYVPVLGNLSSWTEDIWVNDQLSMPSTSFNFRAVLRWDLNLPFSSTPKNLDEHLMVRYGNTSKELYEGGTVSYTSGAGFLNIINVQSLGAGRGVETVVGGGSSTNFQLAIYQCYYDGSSTTSEPTNLWYSANVRMHFYGRDPLLSNPYYQSIIIPPDGVGRWWNVLSINGSASVNTTIVNTISSTAAWSNFTSTYNNC